MHTSTILVSITRKWFPLQGELAPLKKMLYFLINNKPLLIRSMLAAGIVPGHVCWRSCRRRRRRRGDYWRLLLLLLLLVVQQPKVIYLANPVSSDKVFFSADYISLDVYSKIQVGVELLPLGNSRNSRWRPT